MQVSLVETIDDLMMNFKVIEGLTKPLGSITEMVRNDCRVVFDGEATCGSYVYNRRRNEYCKIFLKNGIYLMPVWVRIPGATASEHDEKNS